jgi:outer membrane protein insertion porin family
VDTQSTLVGAFGSESVGGGVRFGIPIGEDKTINLGLSGDSTRLNLIDTSPQRYKDYVAKNGKEIRGLTGTVGWENDERDSALFPTRGTYQRAILELTLPGSTATYARPSYQYQRFIPIGRDYTLMLNGEYALAKAYGNKELPFFKNLYAGGIGSVRGFDASSLGPRDAVTGDVLGGDTRLVANAEFYAPLPGMGRDRSMRFSGFVDAGGVGGYGTKLSISELRYSTGVALSWFSPIGPLKFSLATPLKKQAGDKLQKLQFQLGTVF